MLLPTRHSATPFGGSTRTGSNATRTAGVSGVRRSWMHLAGFRLATATAFTALAVTAMTACGSDNSQDSTPTGATTATSAAAAATSAAAAPAPTAEELQTTLNGFVDPAKPTAEKEKLVVGGGKRAANIDTMTKGLANYGTITFTVADVKTEGDQATGQVTITSPHGPAGPMPMTWQHSAAGWQLSDASACQILAMGMAPCQP